MCYVYTIISHVRYYAASKLVSIQELKHYTVYRYTHYIHLETEHGTPASESNSLINTHYYSYSSPDTAVVYDSILW